jgi:hypothetical protein
MATFVMPIVNAACKPDNNGDTYFEPANVNLLANDFYDRVVMAFASQSARRGFSGAFRVPANYVGTPKIVGKWLTTATSGDVVFDFDYRAVADNESGDPTTDQESVSVTETADGTARDENAFELALTAANLAPGDLVLFSFVRDAADAADTLAATAWVEAADLGFQYADA